jgi:phosphoenolpyruvate carboxylase
MFRDCRLFRIILDELEKTLVLACQLPGTVPMWSPDEIARETIFSMIEPEYRLTRDMALRISGDKEVAQCFDRDRLNREQVERLRRFYTAEDELTKEQYKSALLLSINCIAAGFGATG